jgi:hypothetical protein
MGLTTRWSGVRVPQRPPGETSKTPGRHPILSYPLVPARYRHRPLKPGHDCMMLCMMIVHYHCTMLPRRLPAWGFLVTHRLYHDVGGGIHLWRVAARNLGVAPNQCGSRVNRGIRRSRTVVHDNPRHPLSTPSALLDRARPIRPRRPLPYSPLQRRPRPSPWRRNERSQDRRRLRLRQPEQSLRGHSRSYMSAEPHLDSPILSSCRR